MKTCPRAYASDPSVQSIVQAYNWCGADNPNRTGLTVLYPQGIPNVVIEGLTVLDSAIGRSRARDHERREKELDALKKK
jgi:hypothetical protein